MYLHRVGLALLRTSEGVLEALPVMRMLKNAELAAPICSSVPQLGLDEELHTTHMAVLTG